MQVISADRFNQQITPGNVTSEKIYQNILLKQGPVFALDQKISAIKYCQVYLQKNPQSSCLLVQEESYFQLWKEELTSQEEINCLVSSLSQNTDIASSNNMQKLITQNNDTSINSEVLLEFINLSQKLLVDAIGLIGNTIYQQSFNQNINLNCQEFIEILAKKIPDTQQSLKFKKNLITFIEEKIGFNILLKEISTQLQNSKIEVDIISLIDTNKVITKMRGINGITIKNRRYNLQYYSNCFIGSELVNWMVSNFNFSIKQAVRLGQRMMKEKLIYCVTEQKDFKNKYLFYSFPEYKSE